MRESTDPMTTQNPTAGDGGASTPDPIDRLDALLAAQDGGGTQDDNEPAKPAADNPGKPTDGEQGNDQEPQFTTTHLAKYLGIDESMVDVDAEGQPVFKTKIDGKESTAKFPDFLKDYQLKGHAENRVREAAEKEKAADRKVQEAEQAIAARHQELQSNLQQINDLARVAHAELSHDYQSVNWPELRANDPARAALLELEFQKRNGRIQSVFTNLQQRQAQAAHQAEQQRAANEEKHRQTQGRRLLDLIPEWRDAEVATRERSELTAWIAKSGLDPEDLDLSRASQIQLLRRAWQHDTLQKSKPEIEKKLREAPKLVKPGTVPANDGNAAALKVLKHNVKNASGGNSTKALAAWLEATGKA